MKCLLMKINSYFMKILKVLEEEVNPLISAAHGLEISAIVFSILRIASSTRSNPLITTSFHLPNLQLKLIQLRNCQMIFLFQIKQPVRQRIIGNQLVSIINACYLA